MKQILLFTIVVLMLSAFFLTGCKKELPVKNSPPTTDSVKTIALINSATFSTVVSDFFNCMTTDKAGNIYTLKYTVSNTIFKVSASGQETALYTAEKTAADTSTNSFTCLTTDTLGNVYTLNLNSLTHIQSILKITPTGAASTFLNNITQYINPASNFIYKIAIDENGSLYFGDLYGIHKLTTGGTLTTVLASTLQIHFAVDKSGDVIYSIQDGNNTDVVKVSLQGTKSVILSSGKIYYNGIGDITVDKLGNIFISDLTTAGINAIYAINIDNELFTLISSTNAHVDGPVATAKIFEPIYMSTDDAGELYFFEVSNNGVGNDIRKVTF